ncbi:high-affinity Cu transporter CTR1 [Kluyveromyces lactis]|uniref:Copper transport protein n=1 Tax=Kluyveromyces lactis (strain ATCC 8585 / CBS 2359 / DSM 70799 / NBRC 1267 / NRRL Y-1140 / WM37) TaxID=284590 RepID=Q6CVK2_KLULA|nr:uncharacterized protein KLLA0_B11407g [Kluyveromyces lactis]CAH02430.1 KLLA0B11407p [Kluyveromyces lactis]|eukprot:XP_452037.1 uncharacterized protein KLLA0_B11407g [Kluyveromyces lactis]
MNMHAGDTTTSASAMAMSTSTSSSMSGMDMDGGSEMTGMNSYLTRKYMNYPVVFEKLYASDRGEAFGIFLLIVVAAFVYKFLLFVSWYLELKWFKKAGVNEEAENDEATGKNVLYTIEDLELQRQFLPTSFGKFMFNVFAPDWVDFFHDFVRLLITFCSTMIIYMLMLVAMTFVLAYVFAVILGLSLAEIFFNRIKINMLKAWELKKEWERRFKLCQCGPGPSASTDDTRSFASSKATADAGSTTPLNTFKSSEKVPKKVGCCCNGDEDPEEEAERKIRGIATQREQAGNMNVDLLPAENFK